MMASTEAGKAMSSDLVMWYGFFCLSSVGMQLLNKAIAEAFRERGVIALDNLLMVWQQVAAIVLNFICMHFIGGPTWSMNRITWVQVRRLAVPSVNFVLMLICSLKALKTVHVATVVVARNVCTVFVCAGEAMLFQKYTSRRSLLTLLVIILGSIVYGKGDLAFEPEGYFWQGLNSVLFVVGQLYEKWAMGRSAKDQTPLGISTIKNSVSLPVLFVIMAVQGDFRSFMGSYKSLDGVLSPGNDIDVSTMSPNEAKLHCGTLASCAWFTYKGAADDASSTTIWFKNAYASFESNDGWTTFQKQALSQIFSLPTHIWVCIIVSGAGTCALSICYMTLYKISSATAITVGGNFNKAISIIAASYLFRQGMGLLQVCGLCVCILGSLWFSMESTQSSPQKPASTAPAATVAAGLHQTGRPAATATATAASPGTAAGRSSTPGALRRRNPP